MRGRRHPRLSVYLVAKDAGGLEYDHPSCPELEIFSGLGISPPPCGFFLDNKFAEAADEEVFPPFQGPFDELKETFGHSPGLAFAESDLMVDSVDDLFFGQGHLMILLNLYRRVKTT